MVVTPTSAASGQQITPSRVFPLPNASYNGKPVTAASITPHGGVASNIGGSDIPADKGSTIVSITSGTLISSAYDPYGGNVVLMKGNDGNIYYYAHMLAPFTGGPNIQAGQLLGQVDNSGNAANTIPHLHIGICTGTNANCIQDGTGANGGIGNGNLDAVAMLKALAADPRSNNQAIADSANGAPGSTPVNPPDLSSIDILTNPFLQNFGFTEANKAAIALNIQEALKNNIDPLVWIGIVANESRFKDGVVNPSSGACGFAQLDPCPSGQQWGVANIDAGIAKFKQFLAQCNGNLTCALDEHYSGGLPGYTATITQIGQAIQQLNPDLVTKVQAVGPISSALTNQATATAGQGPALTDFTGGCTAPQNWFDIAGVFNFTGCVIGNIIKTWVQNFKNWWKEWQTAYMPNALFMLAGVILFFIGLNMMTDGGMNIIRRIVQGPKDQKKAAPAKVSTEAPAAAEEAAPAAEEVGGYVAAIA